MAFKKILSAVMAGALVLSIGATAFAAGGGPTYVNQESFDQWGTDTETTVNVPTIKISVPETVTLVANPYKLTFDGTGLGLTSNEKGQIISPAYHIKNLSNVDIDVTMSAAGWANGEVEFATATTATATKKQAFLQIDYAAGPGTSDTAVTGGTQYTVKALDTPEKVNTSPVTLLKSNDGIAVATTGSFDFQFKGDCTLPSKLVTTGDSAQLPWNEEDTFGASVVFDFLPRDVT